MVREENAADFRPPPCRTAAILYCFTILLPGGHIRGLYCACLSAGCRCNSLIQKQRDSFTLHAYFLFEFSPIRGSWTAALGLVSEVGFPDGSAGEESTCNAGDAGSIPGSGGAPGGRYGNPLQYSCLKNSMDRKAWRATIHEVTKSQM